MSALIDTQFDLTTEQGVFDHVATALIAQGRRSVRLIFSEPGQSTCMYRAPDGAKCAAGHLIPDRRYHDGIEGRSFVLTTRRVGLALNHDQVQRDALDPRIPQTDTMLDLIARLQRAHDTKRPCDPPFVTAIKNRFTRIAEQHGLSIEVLA